MSRRHSCRHTDLISVELSRHPGGQLGVSADVSVSGPDRVFVHASQHSSHHAILNQTRLVEPKFSRRHSLAEITDGGAVGEGGDEGVDISEGGKVALLPGDVGQEVLLELPVSPEDGDERGDGVDVAVLEDGGYANNLNQTMFVKILNIISSRLSSLTL